MRIQGRVAHILIERLENAYVRTLCGRIIHYPAGTFRIYSDSDYFTHNHPDCQDCLGKHFSAREENHAEPKA